MPAPKKPRAAKPSRPLPGSLPSTPPGMADYIVILKEASIHSEALGRREIYERNLGQAAEFQRKLRHWLDERGLSSQVAGMAEPTGFPLITLTCTLAVAKAIELLPEVDSVVRDSNMVGLVPRSR